MKDLGYNNMSLYVSRLHNLMLDRGEDIVDFVKNKPITAMVYSLSMKILGIYCAGFLYPLGSNLFWVLLTSSIILDITAFSNFGEYIANLLGSIETIKKQILLRVSEFYNEHVSDLGRSMLHDFFFRE
jgi:hypothetical protein